MLYEMGIHLNSRVGSRATFDLSVWNKMTDEVSEILECRLAAKRPPFSSYSQDVCAKALDHYRQILIQLLQNMKIACEEIQLAQLLD